MLLKDMKVGEWALVSGFSEAGMRHHTRYLSLGLIPGNKISVLRVAPLGCPLQIKVGSTMLSIRKAEAEEVLVEEVL